MITRCPCCGRRVLRWRLPAGAAELAEQVSAEEGTSRPGPARRGRVLRLLDRPAADGALVSAVVQGARWLAAATPTPFDDAALQVASLLLSRRAP